MTATELFEQYIALDNIESKKFGVMYDANIVRINQARVSLDEIIRMYKEPINLSSLETNVDKLIDLADELAADLDLKGVTFTEDDIVDKDRLERMILKEALPIFEKSPNGRDLDTVKFCVRQGKIAELWLIENRDYDEANKKYHDLVDKNGDYTEVKAYDVINMNAPYIQKDIKKLRTESWNISKWYIVFKCTHGKYEFLDKLYVK